MANLLTLARIALIIPFAAMFFIAAPSAMSAALAIFVVAASTDFLDGWVARARGEASALGAALDPLADKLLIAAALILLIRNGVIAGMGVVAALVIILREILVGGLREAVAIAGGRLPVTPLAKGKTASQMVAAGLLLAAAPGGVLGEAARPLASGVFWLAAVLTFWTGAGYASAAAAFLRGADRMKHAKVPEPK
ncbi:MAG: CDP-diacylglycerol--glycerol-3-phosphate 3-phosphatidyltransferase [Parvularculaceae bacterium]